MKKIVGISVGLGRLLINNIWKLPLSLWRIIRLRGLLHLMIIVGLILILRIKSLDILIPIVVGIFISDFLKSIWENILIATEDKRKTKHDNKYLKQIYNGNYEKTVVLHNQEISFLYDECFVNNENYNVVIKDDPNKMFELDSIIKNNYTEIMRAHKGSYIRNIETIRLDGYSLDSNTLTLSTSRSTYYNHLLTNRAIDYEIEKELSIRKIFEYGPLLTPFEISKMSNHIGINGLVLLNDGYTILPRRGDKATYSKNKITASIAAPLISGNIYQENKEKQLTTDSLENEVKNLLKRRLYIDVDTLSESSVEVIFLGFGREVYEGGKPQFYYLIKLNSLSSTDYIKLLKDKKKEIKKNKAIDKDSNLFVCNLASLKAKKNYSGSIECINYYTKKVKFKSAEFSFFANYLHLEKSGYLKLFHVNNETNNIKETSGGAKVS